MPKRVPCPRLACSALELVVQQERGAAVKGMEAEIVRYQDVIRDLDQEKDGLEHMLSETHRDLDAVGRELDVARSSQRNLRAVLADKAADLERVFKQNGDLHKRCQLLERRLAACSSASSGDLLVGMDTLYAASALKKQALNKEQKAILSAHNERMRIRPVA
jgi:septal ring factor EnvC (AmiA/AmiB activator)